MLIDGGIGADLKAVADSARRAEEEGYDAVWTAEVGHDPFLALTLAAEHTRRIGLGTGIAVAFGRSPMTLAPKGWNARTPGTDWPPSAAIWPKGTSWPRPCRWTSAGRG